MSQLIWKNNIEFNRKKSCQKYDFLIVFFGYSLYNVSNAVHAVHYEKITNDNCHVILCQNTMSVIVSSSVIDCWNMIDLLIFTYLVYSLIYLYSILYHTYIKSQHKKFGIFWKPHIYGVIWKWDVLYIIATCVLFASLCYMYLICNNRKLLSWDIACMRWWGQERNLPNVAQQNNPQWYWLKFIICHALLIWLISSNALCVAEPGFCHIILPDPTVS